MKKLKSIQKPPIQKVDTAKVIKPITKPIKKKREIIGNIIELSIVAIPVIVIETFSPDK